MKHQQVLVDYWTMLKTSGLCLLLAFCGYILLRMVQTIFWLPNHLKMNQQRLEELAQRYAKEMNIDEKERLELESMIKGNEPLTDERIQKFLDMPVPEEPKKDL